MAILLIRNAHSLGDRLVDFTSCYLSQPFKFRPAGWRQMLVAADGDVTAWVFWRQLHLVMTMAASARASCVTLHIVGNATRTKPLKLNTGI